MSNHTECIKKYGIKGTKRSKYFLFIFRYTHNEKRYHSEVRQEAVQQALAAINQGKQSNNALGVPMPSKRISVMQRSSANGDEVGKKYFIERFAKIKMW